MRINTSGLYTKPFYRITNLEDYKSVIYFSDIGNIEINHAILTAFKHPCKTKRLKHEAEDYIIKLEKIVNSKSILFQPFKFDVKAAMKCHLIPFNVGPIENCLIYNYLDYDHGINVCLNLELYQALVDKSVDPDGHLAKNINWCKKFYAHYSTDTKYIFSTGTSDQKPHSKDILHGEDRLFVEHFSKELLEEVYEALITAEG